MDPVLVVFVAVIVRRQIRNVIVIVAIAIPEIPRVVRVVRSVVLTVRGLPVDEPITSPIYVDLPPAARRVYDEMEEEMYTTLRTGPTSFS